jgi:ADP-ribose pyrophosphatase YjhB (NUDIX family)
MPHSVLPRVVAAVIAVVVRDDQVLLVRRGRPPAEGMWGVPGGKMEFGETVLAAAERELFEETAVRAEAVRAFQVIDALDRDADGIVRHHHMLAAVACRWIEGEPVAGDDAAEAAWFRLDRLDVEPDGLIERVAEVAREAAGIVEDPDNPELTAEQIAAARPFAEVFPDLADSIRRSRAEGPKELVTLQVSAEAVARFKALYGDLWQVQMCRILQATNAN